MSNPMCGLWHANVSISKYNEDGTCPCIGCFGGGCHTCSTYRKLQDANMELSITEKTKCQLCLEYMAKTK